MREILNGMLQAQAAGLAMVKMKTWQDHFADVCREAGLVVRDGYNRTGDTLLTIENPTGAEIDLKPLCTEANKRTFGTTEDISLTPPTPMTREEWDRKIDERETDADAEALKVKAKKVENRKKILEIAEGSLRMAQHDGDHLNAIGWMAVLVAIKGDLI